MAIVKAVTNSVKGAYDTRGVCVWMPIYQHFPKCALLLDLRIKEVFGMLNLAIFAQHVRNLF